MTMHVRDFRETDRPALTALWEACGLTRPWNDPNDDIDRAVSAREATILVGYRGDQLIGSVMAGHDGHRGWVYYLALDPAHQGRGAGRELMEEAGLWLTSRGAPKLELMVRDGNDRAAKFYESIGFERQQVTVYGKWLKAPSESSARKAS
ncbi:GNAT family acetyltransferase [Hyphomonas jannaschiana]|uniref:Putative acetyltransferase n=1 Tax=Hyphomonas jannaschiana VP2 TaxID=1280952 RepID=A0A059FHV1_9PROT|nr:GNAT family acetyltransferase [Hyphomonas jannaschiana]KCZ90229.1 putative acetyltransferase [Hyphomonas jannaschiana VP2]